MSRPPRIEGFSYTGQYRYFLTFCTRDRRSVFTDTKTVDIFSTQLRKRSELDAISINAYCVMPDHVHLLATGINDTSNLREFVTRTKQRSGWTFKNQIGHRLWQEGYYDHVLREDDDPYGVIAYIINNPIRGGLVASPADYPFWGSFTHSRDEILDFIASAPHWTPPR